jgi:hypothetical protein
MPPPKDLPPSPSQLRPIGLVAQRFPRSPKKPRTASRHLHTGHHPASRQAPAGFIPDHRTRPGFDVIHCCFDASAVVRLRSSHDSPHDASFDAFSLTLTTSALDQSRSGLFEVSPCRAAPEGPPPSSFGVTTRPRPPVSFRASWHTCCCKRLGESMQSCGVSGRPGRGGASAGRNPGCKDRDAGSSSLV